MKVAVQINGREVVSSMFTGFSVENFDHAYRHITLAVERWKGELKAAKKDFEILKEMAERYQAMLEPLKQDVKSAVELVEDCWESFSETCDENHPVAVMANGAFNAQRSVIEPLMRIEMPDYNRECLNSIYADGGLESLIVSVELTLEEEEAFGVNRLKLLALRFKTGVRITKNYYCSGDHVYSLHLPVAPLNFMFNIISNEQLNAAIAPIVVSYIQEFTAWLNAFEADWNTYKSGAPVLPDDAYEPVRRDTDADDL